MPRGGMWCLSTDFGHQLERLARRRFKQRASPIGFASFRAPCVWLVWKLAHDGSGEVIDTGTSVWQAIA